jgi:hypothetical protein
VISRAKGRWGGGGEEGFGAIEGRKEGILSSYLLLKDMKNT